MFCEEFCVKRRFSCSIRPEICSYDIDSHFWGHCGVLHLSGQIIEISAIRICENPSERNAERIQLERLFCRRPGGFVPQRQRGSRDWAYALRPIPRKVGGGRWDVIVRLSVHSRCTSEIMTVLLLLSNADGICLIDAITTGGIAVLKKLYEFNRSDCESAIIQMIKYKISCTHIHT